MTIDKSFLFKYLLFLMKFEHRSWFDSGNLRRVSGIFSKITLVHSKEKDESYHSFVVKILTKSLHKGGVRRILHTGAVFKIFFRLVHFAFKCTYNKVFAATAKVIILSYKSRAVSNFYVTEFEIWLVFSRLANTGGFHLYLFPFNFPFIYISI